MTRDDLITIICRLNNCDNIQDEMHNFKYELSERKYEISLKRLKGKIHSFELIFIGMVKDNEVKNETC